MSDNQKPVEASTVPTEQEAPVSVESQVRKHSPLPWRFEPDGIHFKGFRDKEWHVVRCSDGRWVAIAPLDAAVVETTLDEQRANTELIVRACNSHYQLVEALDLAREDLALWHERHTQNSVGGIETVSCSGCATCETLDAIDAALKAAKEQQP